MAISSTLTKNIWPGNGVATLWPFHFRINSAEHLAVILADASGAETELDPSLYAVTGAGEDEGSVTYPLTGDPLATGWSITLARRTPRTQETDLDNQGGLYLKVIERTVDGLTMMVQEQQEQLDRAAKMPISSPESADALISSVRESASAAAQSASEAEAAAGSAVADVQGALDDKVDAADAARIAAETALAQVLATYGDFDRRYLGVKSVEPATDNDGNPLFPGALCYLQPAPDVTGAMLVYTGTMWVAAYVNGDSILTVENLLALLATLDATQKATARGNIGAVSAADVASAISAVPAPLGVGQTWQDVTGSRVKATNYTNGTGQTIFVSATITVPANTLFSASVDGMMIAQNSNALAVAQIMNIQFPVQAGEVYRIDTSATTITKWVELRQ